MEGAAGTTNPGVVAKKGDSSPISMSVNDFNKPNESAGGDGGGETAEQKAAREALANETPEQKAAREALANETPEQKQPEKHLPTKRRNRRRQGKPLLMGINYQTMLS
jgi:hypothetical protein